MSKKLDVAYFTMEIGLSSRIPTFAGGLGILAADMMRSCADLGMNVACVTGCWKFGYLHQELHQDGTQSYQDFAWDPSKELRKIPQVVQVSVEGRPVNVGAWILDLHGQKGQAVPVIFLDTDVDGNTPEDRDITKHLYGGDQAMRIKQEIVLGIGGVRMLRALGFDKVGCYHLNEGHCSFLTLELLRERGFDDQAVRKSCAFTTHTPVKAGHDVFPYDLAWKIVGDMLPWHIKKIAGEDALSMTTLAMTLSKITFGVSRIHGDVSRSLLNNQDVRYITNGAHHIEWTSPEMQALFDAHIPGWRDNPSLLSQGYLNLPNEELWKAHQEAKKRLLAVVNAQSEIPFELDRLTLVTARRIVPYKRPELLYANLMRLKEVAQGKLQIIHAGNAHPHDAFSQDVIKHIIERSRELKDSVRIAYLPNYSPDLAKLLVSGADVWLNTPTRLLEASGTSGMKACLNGVPNLSTLDGWWIEGFEMDPESGWRIGPLAQALNAEDTRQIDAEDLYTQLQYEVIPTYEYPGRQRWIHRMKRAVKLMGQFNAHRCVREYAEKAWNTMQD